MYDAVETRRCCTPQGWRFDAYLSREGCWLLVPTVPDWELQRLRIERAKSLTAGERLEPQPS